MSVNTHLWPKAATTALGVGVLGQERDARAAGAWRTAHGSGYSIAMTTGAIILAAGQGKRMRSTLPKVLHPACDLPLVAHVVALAKDVGCSPIVVVVDPMNGKRVEETLRGLFPDTQLTFAVQEKALGTGDAARSALPHIKSDRVLVLCGDVPLLGKATVEKLMPALQGVELAMLTAKLPDPTGYGRVVRQSDTQMRIVEHKDASEKERAIDEVNVAVYLCGMQLMQDTVASLKADNAQAEYYLTDIVSRAKSVRAVDVADIAEMSGINTQAQLAEVDRMMRDRIVRAWQEKGVRFRDPQSVSITPRASFGEDVVIGPGVQFYGTVKLGNRVVVEGPTVLKDVSIGDGTRIESFCHLESAKVASNVKIGPYARLRPGANLADDVHIGNFVEVKNSNVAKGSKANHLAYLGDADIGAGVNVGAGTITCNYDGTLKHRTTIGGGVFVGSNSTLVAPVSLGEHAYVAAGSTITKDVPADALAFGRARQEVRLGYAKALRERLDAAKAKAKKG